MASVTLVLKRRQNLEFVVPEDFSQKSFFLYGKEKHADRYRVTFEYDYPLRTTGRKSQNHNLNGGIQQICEETGNDFDDVKRYIKFRAIRRGYPIKKDSNGNPMYSIANGDPIPESETKASTIECGYLIDELQCLAAELGIALRK